jgi:divalent metal cation (Fe/Co/Zn/Cd) transporter
VLAGVLAGSVALVGNGLDSGIEAIASVIIVWGFWRSRIFAEASERKAQQLVAVTLLLLALPVAFQLWSPRLNPGLSIKAPSRNRKPEEQK